MKKWIKFFAIALSFMFVASCTATTLCLVNVTFESEQNEESSPSTEDSDVSTTTPEEGGETLLGEGEEGSQQTGDTPVSATATDMGVYDEVTYWISDSSYFSTEWQSEASGTASDPFIIGSAEDLAGLSYLVFTGSTFSGCYFEQTDDINLSAHYWMPIGGHGNGGFDEDCVFEGNYDGQGYSIKNLKTYLDETASDLTLFDDVGLFGYVCGLSSEYATIKNLTIESAIISGDSNVAGLVGMGCYITISNCVFSGGDVTAVATYIGGMIGRGNAINVFSCTTVSSTIYSSSHDVGGLGGLLNGTVVISDCVVDSSIIYDSKWTVGGIVAAATSDVEISNCQNLNTEVYCDSDSGYHIGGILGYGEDQVFISECANSGAVYGAEYVGGIAGRIISNAGVDDCLNSGRVSGTSSTSYGGIGGILGTYTDSYVENCQNSGEIVGVTSKIGGIVGYSSHGKNIYNCINTGNVSGCGAVAGIVGQVSGNDRSGYLTINCCENSGAISDDSGTGCAGIAGYVSQNSTSLETCYNVYIYDCYNVGEISGYVSSGGVVGWVGTPLGSQYAITEVHNCYNVAGVSAVGYAGGIAGSFSGNYDTASYSILSNCFNLGNVTSTGSGSNVRVGGVAAYLSYATIYCSFYNCTITNINSTYTVGVWDSADDSSGCTYDSALSYHAKSKSWFEDGDNWRAEYAWDFDSVWAISAGLNDGYPVLKAQLGNFLEFDSVGGYWFFEDGKFPQSAVEDSDLIANLEAYAVRNGESYAVGSENFSVWAYDGNEYVKVTADGENGTASDSDCTWFLVEPIVWIVAYGTADEVPTDVSTAVSALVVTLGSYKASSSADVTYVSLYATTYANSMAAMASGELSFSVTDSITYDLFNTTASQTAVFSVNLGNATSSNTTVTSAGYRVASVNEIDALGGAYATECSDFVAFLLSGGSSASGYVVDYWTRDLAYSLAADSYYSTAHSGKAYSYDGTYNQGVYVTSDGIISNATLKNVFGARLSISL